MAMMNAAPAPLGLGFGSTLRPEGVELANNPAETQLALPARLLEEALVQDEHHLRLSTVCEPGRGSAHYSGEAGGPHFDVKRIAAALPPELADRPACGFMRHGVLPEIQRMWRSFDSVLILWKYADAKAEEVLEYQGVTQQIVGVAVARPKAFVSGVDFFLVLSTPVEVSLHALCFAPGNAQQFLQPTALQRVATVGASPLPSPGASAASIAPGDTRLLPPVRTRHVAPTDDIVVGAIAADIVSGRIFLGGSDGCIHELQYFDDEAGWFGRPRKCYRSCISWNLQSQLPTGLRKVSEKLFGPAEAITQLVVDSARGYLLSLSSGSSVTLFRLPQGQDAAPVQLTTLSQVSLSNQVVNIHAQVFPGLAATASRSMNPFASSASMPSASSTASARAKVNIVKLVPFGLAEGGSIIACAITQEGTRIFLASTFSASSFSSSSATSSAYGAGAPNVNQPDSSSSMSSSTSGAVRKEPLMTGLAVHHVRFLDTNCAALRVKDAVHSDGNTLLLCRISSTMGGQGVTTRTWGAELAGNSCAAAPAEEDAVVAVSTDLRAIAQHQARARPPHLMVAAGLTEHIEVVRIAGGPEGCRAIALADYADRLGRSVESLYGRRAPAGLVLPIQGLSELAQQQLLPPPRYVFASNFGIHVLEKVRPVDSFRQQVLKGDIPSIREFALQYTADQTCALCFQLLTGAAPKLVDSDRIARARSFDDSNRRLGSDAKPAQTIRGAMAGREELSPDQEVLLLRVEHLLLDPQLSSQMGFVQTWPGIDSGSAPTYSTPLGHLTQNHGAQRISGRIRGLCLYLSRILRPMWLAPVMDVSWPVSPQDPNRLKRRRDDWWPPPPEPSPSVLGSKWKCAWSREQRSFVLDRLTKLSAILERCKNSLLSEQSNTGPLAGGFGTAPATNALMGWPSAAGYVTVPNSNRADVEGANAIVNGLALLVSTAIEVLGFLELVAVRADVLGTAPCPPEALVRFAELTFRDLVCLPEARGVLQQLMRAGVVVCRQLHAKCPRLFSADDLEIQEAYELLGVVQTSLAATRGSGSNLDMARLSHLVQQPLRTLERHAAKVDLTEVSERLRKVGACKGLVALCIRIARARDPRDEALRPQDPTSSRVQQLHYMRLECYQVVLEVCEALLALAQQHQGLSGDFGSGGMHRSLAINSNAMGPGARLAELPELVPVPMVAAEAKLVLDALLRHCLEGRAYGADELFHFCVFKWMMQRELPVYRYDSPYLRGFLDRQARDQPELVCYYFQHRERWAEACDSFMALVQGAGRRNQTQLTHEDKLRFLQSALNCARMPGSGRRVEPIMQMIVELGAARQDQLGQM